jgi:hypothetical protein
MDKKPFIKADEVANDLEISKSHAYKLVRELNDELKKNGYITISGRVSRRFFEEKMYGSSIHNEGRNVNAGI